MVKYATRFQLALYLQQGYTIVDWGMGQAGLYLNGKSGYRAPWHGKNFLGNYQMKTGTTLAASGTREELETLVREFLGN